MSEITDAERAAWQALVDRGPTLPIAAMGDSPTTWGLRNSQRWLLHVVQGGSDGPAFLAVDAATMDLLVGAVNALPRLLAALTQAEGEIAWLHQELDAEVDIRAGRVRTYPTMDALVADLEATQPPLPDPAAPQQLGLLDGPGRAYASDHGKGW